MKKALNVLLGLIVAVTVALLVYAMASEHSDDFTKFDASVSMNLIWGYILMGAAVLAVIGSAVYGMIKDPASVKGTLISLVIIVVVVGIAYFVSSGHVADGLKIPNSAGGFFEKPGELIVSETGILVAYVAMAGAIIAALYSEVANLFK